MQQEDYILRQIDQIGLMLEKLFSDILGFKAQGRVSEEVRQVDNTLKDEFDYVYLPMRLILRMGRAVKG
ncbi:MAG: hypothetical protein ABFC28_07560 [Rikenellaceae bacterium]